MINYITKGCLKLNCSQIILNICTEIQSKKLEYLLLICLLFLGSSLKSQNQKDDSNKIKQGVYTEYPDSLFNPEYGYSVINTYEHWYCDLSSNHFDITDDRTYKCNYPNKKVKRTAEYSNNLLNGIVEYYIFDTILVVKGMYCNGTPCGNFTNYTFYDNNLSLSNFITSSNISHKSGLLNGPQILSRLTKNHKTGEKHYYTYEVVNYYNGQKNGPTFYYDEDGTMEFYELYLEGKLINGKFLGNGTVRKYKNHRIYTSWSYSPDNGKLIQNSNTSQDFKWKHLNFNKFKFPIKKAAKSNGEYYQYINGKLK